MATRKPPFREPWKPAPYIVADIYAIKALRTGTANAIQQQRALDWIMHIACEVDHASYRPGSSDDTAFAEGKRHIGLQIRKLETMSADIVQKMKDQEDKNG